MPSFRAWLLILLIAILLAFLPSPLPPEFPAVALAHPQLIAVASLFKRIALEQRHRLALVKSANFPSSSNTASLDLDRPPSLHTTASEQGHNTTTNMPARTPVYFISHGGPNVMEETSHPAYAQLQQIGREITQKVKPKAIIVSSVSLPNRLSPSSLLLAF